MIPNSRPGHRCWWLGLPTLEHSLKILFINNNGGGFADHIDINEGTTVGELFAERVTNPDPSAYLIRVNRQPCAKEQVLLEGDRVSITPTKIEGATVVRAAV